MCTASSDSYEEDNMLDSVIVKQLCNGIKGRGYFVFCDTLSSKLLKDLGEGIYRCGISCSTNESWLTELKDVDFLERGKHVSCLVNDGSVEAFVWRDKRNINFLNTLCNSTYTTCMPRKLEDARAAEPLGLWGL